MPNISVRTPDDLHEEVQRAAEEDMRSVNSEIVFLIKSGIALRKATMERVDDFLDHPETGSRRAGRKGLTS